MTMTWRIPAFLATGCLLYACAPKVLTPSGPPPPPSPQTVKIYQEQPGKYELLGDISLAVTPEMKWDERGDSTAGFEALKAKAAAMGGNGLLLKSAQGNYDTSVGAGYNGKYYLVPLKREPRTVFGQAIYVRDD